MAVNFDNVVGLGTLEDGGYAGRLLGLALAHLEASRDNSQLSDENVGEVYAATINGAMNQAVQFELNKEAKDKQLEILEQQRLAEYIKNGSGNPANSIYQANIDNVLAKTTAMNEQVVDNRKIKALDSLSETYGTFGAGGLDLTSDMWGTYFGIVATLSGQTAPTNTGASKVT